MTTTADLDSLDPEFMDRERTLYRYSGMVDVLRDNAKELLDFKAGPAADTTPALPGLDTLNATMAATYTRLRTSILGTLPTSDAAQLGIWTRELADDASTVSVWEAASTLARFVDLLFNTDAFVASRVSQRREIDKLLGKTAEDARAKSGSGGQYL